MLHAATRFAASLFLACAIAHGTASARVLDGGVDNTFAISSPDKALWAWGGNVGGKLGNGTTMNTSIPVPVSELAHTGLAAGFYHTCVWNQGTGAAHCWGWNSNGQLGNDSTDDSWQPVPVNGLSSGVMTMAAGRHHTCAITDGGALKCWGSNFYKQMGVASSEGSHVPVEVLPSGIAAVAASERHTCALTTSGGVKCWGTNDTGQLGTGTPGPHPSPVNVPGLSSGVAAITMGVDHTCALTTAGAVMCWGGNTFGQLGINSAAASASSPTTLPDLPSGVIAISAGSYHTCAILASGTARCWGRSNAGQVGDGFQANRIKPVNVQVLAGNLQPVAIQAGFNHTCAVTVLRQVFCWGSNEYGEVGDNGPPATPRLVPTATWYMAANVASLSVGGLHTCSVYKYAGAGAWVLCWGHNAFGELGDNTNSPKPAPVFPSYNGAFPYPLHATAVSAGNAHTLAIRPDRTVWAWGSNHLGQLGVGRDKAPESCFTPNEGAINCSKHPIRVPGLTGIIAVGAGWGHSIALRNDGSVWAWGDNQFGQLGRGHFETGYTPQRVMRYDVPTGQNVSLSGISQIAGGYFHGVALQEAGGTLVAWGNNLYGQLGGFFEPGSSWAAAFPVPNFSGVSAISSKGSHTLALKGDEAYAWGLNSYGQVGNGSNAVNTPVLVQTGVLEISAGMSTSMTRRSSRAYAWGLNNRAQLGMSSTGGCAGFTPCKTLPQELSEYPSPLGIAAAGAHSIVIRNDGILATFGDNSSGQLADRTGNFGDAFQQDDFDPLGRLTPQIVVPTGTSISRTTSGTGISLDTLGASIDFGKNLVDSDSSIELPIENLDSTAITFTGITVSGGGFRVPDPPLPPPACSLAITLPQFGTCTITLYYKPGNVNAHYGTLEIQSNAVDNAMLRFGLVGTGVSAPTAPTNVVATAGNGSATVRFDLPSSNGGTAITSYTVTACMNGGPCTGPTATVTVYSHANGIIVGALTNGTPYTFVVHATNALLPGPDSAHSNSVTPYAPVVLIAAEVEEIHDVNSGTSFFLPVDLSQSINGNITVEPRKGGATRSIRLTFNAPINSVGSASTTAGTAQPWATCNCPTSGVILTIPDGTRTTISLNNINGTGQAVSFAVGFLLGDVTSSKAVDFADVNAIKAHAGEVVNGSNFTYDVNRSGGAITASDILVAKRQNSTIP